MTRAELVQSCEWAAAAVEGSQWVGGPDASHAASCAALAQAFRQLANGSQQELDAMVEAEKSHQPLNSVGRFVAAVRAAINAHRAGGQESQSIPALLSCAPLLLACDAASLDFWSASQASAEQLRVGCVAPATAR
jgi:hypothetical protein